MAKGTVVILFLCVKCALCRGAESVQSVQQRRDFIDQSELVVESHDARISSLESQMATPPDLLAQGPLHIVRYSFLSYSQAINIHYWLPS